MNCAIIFWTSHTLDEILDPYDLSILEKFMIIVLIEHILIALKIFMAILIKDKPDWVSQDEANQQNQ